jgi:CheY-like chemotaxis protein
VCAAESYPQDEDSVRLLVMALLTVLGQDKVPRKTRLWEAVDAVANDRVVVVADDSISVRKFVGRMLEKAGYRVKLASDGLEASEIVAQVGCHLIITDLEMPRMNGYELLAHLRQAPATRRIPVLVVTSRAGAKHRERALKEGAVGFLTKPVQEDQLIATVKSLMEAAEERQNVLVPVRQH